jgi:hypothetical protein
MSKRPVRRQQVEAREKPSRYGGDNGGDNGGGDGGHGGDGGSEREPSAEHQIFEDMLQRRMGGGAPPSAEAYAKAMRQWQRLPGAVGFVAVPPVPDSGEAPSSSVGGPDGPAAQGGGKDGGGVP